LYVVVVVAVAVVDGVAVDAAAPVVTVLVKLQGMVQHVEVLFQLFLSALK